MTGACGPWNWIPEIGVTDVYEPPYGCSSLTSETSGPEEEAGLQVRC